MNVWTFEGGCVCGDQIISARLHRFTFEYICTIPTIHHQQRRSIQVQFVNTDQIKTKEKKIRWNEVTLFNMVHHFIWTGGSFACIYTYHISENFSGKFSNQYHIVACSFKYSTIQRPKIFHGPRWKFQFWNAILYFFEKGACVILFGIFYALK